MFYRTIAQGIFGFFLPRAKRGALNTKNPECYSEIKYIKLEEHPALPGILSSPCKF